MSSERRCLVVIDSNSRFEDNSQYRKLPHDSYGFNKFMAIVKDNKLYYKDQFVMDLSVVQHCKKIVEPVVDAIEEVSVPEECHLTGDNPSRAIFETLEVRNVDSFDESESGSETIEEELCWFENCQHEYYWFFITNEAPEMVDDDGGTIYVTRATLGDSTLYFDGNPIAEAHICLYVPL